MNIIVDSNIIFSALLPVSVRIRDELLLNSADTFYSCNYAFVEIFKYKDKIIQFGNDEDVVLNLLHKILNVIHFVNEDYISDDHLKAAYDLCKDVDPKDTPFVGLTLEMNGLLWTGDKRLKTTLKKKGFQKIYDLKAGSNLN